MTAAHCVKNLKPNEFTVVVGDHDVSTAAETSATVVHTVEEVIVNEDYDEATSRNDIALLRLSTPIAYNENVGPVCLPWSMQEDKFEDEDVTLAGWGTTEFGGPKSKTLQKVDVKTTTEAECKADYPNSDDSNICTYAEDKDSCNVSTCSCGRMYIGELTSLSNLPYRTIQVAVSTRQEKTVGFIQLE